jgi:hypothetical protein
MKTQFKILFSVAAFLLMGLVARAQSGPTEEVPGDNFSLEGALELFKKSASPQEFEQLLNSPDSKVNNLDLNGDGNIDYVRVVDKTEGNVHDFILQAVVSASESQDVAVIELEKRNDGTAVLQIVGDADVYGIETIIEPTSEVKVNAGTTTAQTVVNVSAWPSVQYVYGPYYNPWMSPWGWGYYPGWYRPWRPLIWASWYPYWTPYRSYYAMCRWHRIGYASMIYRPYRSSSVIVYNRNYNQINNFRNTSRSYQYNRGGYVHSNRYDNEHRWSRNSYSNGNNGRDSYNGNNSNGRNTGGRTRSDYNRTTRSDYSRTRGDFHSNNSGSMQPQSNSQFSRPTRTFTPSQGNNGNVTVNRGRTFSGSSHSSSGIRSFGGGSNGSPSFHRSQASSPSFRSAPSPQFRSAPSQHFHSMPSHSGGGGGGGSHGGGAHFRGH